MAVATFMATIVEAKPMQGANKPNLSTGIRMPPPSQKGKLF